MLQYEYNDARQPKINSRQIRFNGAGEDSHETFYISKSKPKSSTLSDGAFGFCKTARKPYDVAVCLILMVIHKHAPDVLKISSDGSWNDPYDCGFNFTSQTNTIAGWVLARKLFNELFKEESDLNLSD